MSIQYRTPIYLLYISTLENILSCLIYSFEKHTGLLSALFHIELLIIKLPFILGVSQSFDTILSLKFPENLP